MDKAAIYKVGYGLYMLSAKDGEKDNGCIINTAMQITSQSSIKFIISVNKMNATHDMIKKTKLFNISILTTEAPFNVFEQFGFKSGRDTDKFENIDYVSRDENGILYLTKYTNAYLAFKVIDMIDCDTHTIFLSELTNAKSLSDVESLTYNYYQKNIKPRPEKEVISGWKCRICGYIYEGESLPDNFVCPICKHGAEDFEKISG